MEFKKSNKILLSFEISDDLSVSARPKIIKMDFTLNAFSTSERRYSLSDVEGVIC